MKHLFTSLFAVSLIAISICCFFVNSSIDSPSSFFRLEALTEDTDQEPGGDGGSLPSGWIRGYSWTKVYYNASFQAYPTPISFGEFIYTAYCCVESNQHTACEVAAEYPVCRKLTIHT